MVREFLALVLHGTTRSDVRTHDRGDSSPRIRGAPPRPNRGAGIQRALNEYVRCFTPKTIHGSCEDYRAAATIDLVHDDRDHQAGRKVSAPTLVLWGRRSGVGTLYGGDILTVWREAATEVTGGPLETGHYLAEEEPKAVIEAFERFFV
jgi:pimeloyl-ACP methyl ester carboxylesterase